eukprot:gene769-954_t
MIEEENVNNNIINSNNNLDPPIELEKSLPSDIVIEQQQQQQPPPPKQQTTERMSDQRSSSNLGNLMNKGVSYNRLVDYFIVCGLNRSMVVNQIDRPYQAEILERFPLHNHEDAPLPPHIWMFCFPSGLILEPSPLEPSISMFCLTEFDGARFYASSLIYYLPIPESHIEGELKLLYSPVSISLLSRYPCYDILRKLLCYIYKLVVKNNYNIQIQSLSPAISIPVERIISSIVDDLPKPVSGYKVVINLPSLEDNYHTSLALEYSQSNLPTFPDSNIPFKFLFNLLGIPNVLKIISLALHERKILFLSSNSSLLTIACETISNLLYPFIWPHVYIPILPDLLGDFLQAPTPFIVGMLINKYNKSYEFQNNDIIIINLDKQSIEIPNNINTYLPEIESQKLELKLKQILYPEIVNISVAFPDEFINSFDSDIDINQKIRSAFLGFFLSFFYNIDDFRYILRKYPKSITTFNKASFLMKYQDPDVVTFLSDLIETSAMELNRSILPPTLSTTSAYNSIISYLKSIYKNGPPIYQVINTPSPDISNLQLTSLETPLVQFPAINESLFSLRKAFCLTLLDITPIQYVTPPSSPSISTLSLNQPQDLIPDIKLSSPPISPPPSQYQLSSSQSISPPSSPSSNHTAPTTSTTTNILSPLSISSSLRRGSILKSSTSPVSSPTSTIVQPTIVISNSCGDVSPITSQQQLEDQDLLKEFIQKYCELIFEEEEGLAVDIEQQKLLLDLFALRTSRQYFLESLNSLPPKRSAGLGFDWKLFLLVEIIKRIFNECDKSADFKTASAILEKSKEIYFNNQGQQEPLSNHFFNLDLWKNIHFWESSFFDSTQTLRKEKLPSDFNDVYIDDWEKMNSDTQKESIEKEEDILFSSLVNYAHAMIRLKVSTTDASRFISRMSMLSGLSEQHTQTLEELIDRLYKVNSIENVHRLSSSVSSTSSGELSSIGEDKSLNKSDIKYFTTSVQRNIETEKSGAKQYYQKLLELKRMKSNNNGGKGRIYQTNPTNINNNNNKHTKKLSTSASGISTTTTTTTTTTSTEEGSDKSVDILHERKDGFSVTTLRGSETGISSVAIHSNPQCIISGTSSGQILIWNYEDGKFLQRLQHHKSSVTCIGIGQNEVFSSGSRDKTLRIWNYNGSEWKCNSTLQEHTGEISCLEMKRNTILTGSYDSSMIMWDVRANRKVKRFSGHTGNVLSTSLSHSGDIAITTSSDTTARVWDLRTMKLMHVLSEHNDWVTRSVFGGSNTLYTGGFDCLIKQWDINSGKSTMILSGHAGGINCLAYNQQEQILISGSGDGFLKAWDVNTGFVVKSFKGHKDEIVSILYEGDTLITSSHDQSIRVWNVNTGLCQKVLRGHSDWIMSLASPKHSTLKKFVSASWDGTVKIWDIENLKESGNNFLVPNTQQQHQQKSTTGSMIFGSVGPGRKSPSSSSFLSSSSTIPISTNNGPQLTASGFITNKYKSKRSSDIPTPSPSPSSSSSSSSSTTPSTPTMSTSLPHLSSSTSNLSPPPTVGINIGSSISSSGGINMTSPVGSLSSSLSSSFAASSLSSNHSSFSSSSSTSWQIGSPTTKERRSSEKLNICDHK